MFVFAGKVACAKPTSRRGHRYTARFSKSMSHPSIPIQISDSLYESQHVLESSRFNFQSRDPYADLSARGKWTSVRYDRYEGDLFLECPKLNRVPPRLSVRIIARWGEPFAVIEFKLGQDFCQVCTRPRSGQRGWIRVAYQSDSPIIPTPVPPNPNQSSSSNQRDPDPSSSSNQPDGDSESLASVPRVRSTVVDLDDLAIEKYTEPDDSDSAFPPGRNANLSSIENESAMPSIRDYDFPIEFPIEIDFARVDITSSFL